jgi:hypothetical protein
MDWVILAIGIAIGAAGYYAYDKFFNKAEAAVKGEIQDIKNKL